MKFTKATEKDGSLWSLSEFIALHGRFSIVQEHLTGVICGRFNRKGIWTQVHIEKKVRGIPISDILNNQNAYEVIVVIDEYCLYRKGDIIAYNVIWEDSHPHEAY